MNPLPIDEVLPTLLETFSSAHALVLAAPPGAGKTTRVPIALREAPWLGNMKILMLEPRRLAARRAASYMASLLGESPGGTVGYRIRGDSRVGANTRIEVVTEGILTRLLQSEPDLPGIGLVIFDEFHERSIHADLGLALTLDVQSHLRESLRILVMSATLDHLSVTRVLGNVPLVESKGRAFPVETHFLAHPITAALEKHIVSTVHRAMSETVGDMLVFLPGQREIRRVYDLLQEEGLPGHMLVRMLYGEADPTIQQEALAATPAGCRKIILSSSIAETSLTIDGVRVVIDSGLSRTAQFDPRRGMSGLVTTPVSVASSDQRRGRAGRQYPGVCYRLWTEAQHAMLPAHAPAEILQADLAPLALDLIRWGAPGGEGLRFIDPPPGAHLSRARSLLASLGATDERGVLTPHGRAMAELPIHPRLAHMIIRGKELHLGSLACEIAALMEERDILGPGRRSDVDLTSRIHSLREGGDRDTGVRGRVQAEVRRLRELAGVNARRDDSTRCGILLALAYPDRIARRRSFPTNRYQMVNGTGAFLPEGSLLAREEFLAIGDVDGVGTEVKIFLAAPVPKDELLEAFASEVRATEEVFWDPAEEAVIARNVRRLGGLIIEEGSFSPHSEDATSAIIVGISQMGLEVLPWGKEAASVRSRSEWLRRNALVGPDWPVLADDHLLATLPDWLGPFLHGITRRSHLSSLDMNIIIRSLFSHAEWKELEALAPEAIIVPTGSRRILDYASGDLPVLPVRLQEMFGQTDTPTVARGRVPVLLHLLSPAGRPLAVTRDLRSFWSNAYGEVRKEMRGKYPKHFWPENPLEAQPTKWTKGKSSRRN